MVRRYFFVHTPLGRSSFLVVGFVGVVNLACALADQAQTVPQQNAANPQQSEPSATPNAPNKKPTKSGSKHQSALRDSPSGGTQSQSGIWHPFGPNPRTPKVSTGAGMPQQNFDPNRMADLEKQMWRLVNQDRSNSETFAERGGRAQPLKWNESLAAVARAHSRNMVEQRFFSHVGSDGRTYQMRIDQAGIPWLAGGENIAKWDTVDGAEATFMGEPDHRYNILNALYTDVGVGIVPGPDGNLYITQDFVATPLRRSAVKSGQ